MFVYELSGCEFESIDIDIQAIIECGFTLKRVRDMTRTYSLVDLFLLKFDFSFHEMNTVSKYIIQRKKR